MLNVGYKHDVVMWWNSTKSSKKITLSPNQYKWIIRNASLLFKLFLLLWVALYTFLSCNYSLLCIMCSLHGHWTGIPWTKIKKDSIKITVNTISTIVTQKTIECPRYFSFVITNKHNSLHFLSEKHYSFWMVLHFCFTFTDAIKWCSFLKKCVMFWNFEI